MMIDVKFWANLDGDDSWNDPAMFIGNSGFPYQGKENLTYVAQANLYGKFRDPYNVDKGKTNPHELDLTEDNKIRYNDSSFTLANWTLNFGKIGTLNEVNIIKPNVAPRGCLAEIANSTKTDYAGPFTRYLLRR